jgi:endo-1,3-1,4-beta-glycanase ExoK
MGSRMIGILVLSGIALGNSGCIIDPPPATPPSTGFGRELPLAGHDSATWQIANWAFDACGSQTGWRADHVNFSKGYLELVVNQHDQSNQKVCPGGCWGKDFAGGEYRSVEEYGFGSFQVRMIAAKGSGLVTSFFIYDEDERDEIDIEILGEDVTATATKMQVNYFDNGTPLKNPPKITLPFDASAGWHDYRIEWSNTEIKWYARDKPTDPLVLWHTETRPSATAPWPTNPGKIMMNLWACCTPWCGHLDSATNKLDCFSPTQTARASYHTVWIEQ